jgi:hypothetical protein
VQAADEVIVLSGGRVSHRGTYDELCAAGVQFVQFESIRSAPSTESVGDGGPPGSGNGFKSPERMDESNTSFGPLSVCANANFSESPSRGTSQLGTTRNSCTGVPSGFADAEVRYPVAGGGKNDKTPPKNLSVAPKWELEQAMGSPATVLSPVSPEGSSGAKTPSWSPGGSPESSCVEEALPVVLFPHEESPDAKANGLPDQAAKESFHRLSKQPEQATQGDAPDTLLLCQDSMNLGSLERNRPVAVDSSTNAREGTAVQDFGTVEYSGEPSAGRETLLRVSSREMWASGAGSAKFGTPGPAPLLKIHEDDVDDCTASPDGKRLSPKGGPPKEGHWGPDPHGYRERYPELQPLDEVQGSERGRLLEGAVPSDAAGGEAAGPRSQETKGGPEQSSAVGTRSVDKGSKNGKLIVAEERAVGHVELDMYLVGPGVSLRLLLLYKFVLCRCM